MIRFSSNWTTNSLRACRKKIDKKTSIMWGTYRSLINNAVQGVSTGHEKILELNGVGFRANLEQFIKSSTRIQSRRKF